MSDELLLHGKQFVSSKRAAALTGYAQDYVGQLARSGIVTAERVGGLWYVAMDSLTAYKQNAEAYVPEQPQPQTVGKDSDTFISFDGKDYISASRASKLTGYNQDYVGQLARAGKILSRQIGNRWFVEREGLLAHKSQKDAMLAAVQSEAVGIVHSPQKIAPQIAVHASPTNEIAVSPLMTYFPEDAALMPELKEAVVEVEDTHAQNDAPVVATHVPIRVVREPIPAYVQQTAPLQTVKTHMAPMFIATKAVFAMTVVIVLSYGFVSLKSSSLYSVGDVNATGMTETINSIALTAGAAQAIDSIGDIIEAIVAPELHYIRAR